MTLPVCIAIKSLNSNMIPASNRVDLVENIAKGCLVAGVATTVTLLP